MPFAILCAVLGSFFVAAKTHRKRFWGFIGFTLANVIWFGYGVTYSDFWIVVQFGLFTISSTIGMINNYRKIS